MSRSRIKLISAATAMVGVVLVVAVVNRFFYDSRAIFERISGLDLPSSASIVAHSTVETGPFGVDTYQCIGAQADKETIKAWLSSGEWKDGPVVGNYLHAEHTIPDSMCDSPNVRYQLAEGRRGRLTVVDPETEQAWLLCW